MEQQVEDETPGAEQARPLSVPLTPMIGRDRESALLRDLLTRDDVRLVTLTGPGGVGKTRLALQAVRDLRHAFAGKVFVVDLAPVTDATLLLPAIARTLGMRDPGGRSLRVGLINILGNRPALLLLDNLEHLGDASAELLDLLAACSHVKILATSRVRLRLRGEHEVNVLPLSLPDWQRGMPLATLLEAGAVRLFVERARELRPDFQLTHDNAAVIAEICCRLDGLPLAIELAAARIKMLSPVLLLARLSSRLDLLTGGASDLPLRLRTMRDAIAWSYDLLSADDQAVFRCLAVFRGSFTLEAAEAVASNDFRNQGRVLDALTTLVDHSLVRLEESPSGDSRLILLETVRAFGREQLSIHGEEERARRRLTAWVLALAERAETELRGPAQGVWFDRLETEHDNIRITLEWTIEHDPVSGHRLGGALWQFWKRRGYLSEGRSWLTRVLAANTQVPCRERAAALLAAGDLSRRLSDFEVAETLLEECVALYAAIGDEFGKVRAMHFLALTRQDCGKGDRGHALYMEALASARLLDARPEMAETLNSLGSLALDNADMEVAEAYYQEALGLYRETGNKAGQAAALNNLGEVATAQGNHAQATSLLTEALARYREVGELTGIASTLHSLGVLAISQRRLGQAATHLAESLLRFQRLSDVSRMERCVWSLAGLAVARGDAVRGVRLYAAQRAARERFGDLPSLPIDQDTYDRDLATARTGLGARAFALAWTQGRAMAMEEAISYAVESATDVPNLASGSAASASHGLTSREREVLRLLAAGRSDREIAEVLFISPGTATTHVKHVLQKLGVPSRAAAAAEAVRRNLA